MRSTAVGLVALTLLASSSCGDRAHLWDEALALSGPYKVATQVMWVDSTRGLVFALDPVAGQVHSVSIPRNATFAGPSPDGSRLLVLTGGKEAIYTGQEAEEPSLAIVAPQSSAAPRLVRSYPLPAAFDRLAIAEDGRRAVAFYSSKKASAGVFRNPNEVALFDLDRGPTAHNPSLRTIRSFGAAPHGVAFSPEVAIPPKGGAKHSLAVIMADNYLTFVDMKNLDRAEITVPLAKPDANVTVKPEEVLFSATTATVFVRATGSSDVYALSLTAKKPAGKGENDYLPTINQPSAGKTVRDMVLFSDGGKDLILTANASRDLALIDAATSQFALIPVGEAVDTIVPVPADKPSLALIYSRAQPTARVHFLELEDLAENLEKNLTSRNLAKPVHQLVPTPDGQQALVVHNHTRDVVSILDVKGEHHTVSPIEGPVALNSFDFAGKTHLVGVSPGLPRLGILSLGNLLATDLRLDHNPSKVLAVGGVIVVDHGERQGLVTVVPGPTADRDACRVIWGFFFKGLLDHELQD